MPRTPQSPQPPQTTRSIRRVLFLLALLVLPALGGAQDLPWHQTRIPAPNPAYGLFGTAVALSGDTLVIGGLEKTLNTVIIYVYVRTGDTWARQAAFTLANPHRYNLPPSVAISRDTLAVGLPNEDVRSMQQAGAVHVFVRHGAVWTRQARLTAPDGGMQDFFGTSIALTGDTLAAGAPLARGTGDRRPGAVYVFRRAGTAWTQEARISPLALSSDAYFGGSVSLSGSLLAVGAQRDGGVNEVPAGTAWVFARKGSAWVREARLTGDPSPAQIGLTVYIAGDTLAVGGLSDKAYIFHRRPSGTWFLEAALTRGDDPGAYGNFGFFAGVSQGPEGPLAVVVGNRKTPEGKPTFGAYLFQRESDRTWTRLGLLNDHLQPYGFDIAMAGDTIVLGSPQTGASGEVDIYTPLSSNVN
jgi:hypothetical protein